MSAACAAWTAAVQARDGAVAAPLLLRNSTTLSGASASAARAGTGELRLERELAGMKPDDGSPPITLRPADSLARTAGRPESPRAATQANTPRLSLTPALSLAQNERQPVPVPAPRQQPALPASVRAGTADERTPPETAIIASRFATAPAAADNSAAPAPSAPLPPEDVRPGPSSPVSRDAAPAGELPDLSTITSWSIPPIRWGGNMSSNYGWNGTDTSDTFSMSDSLNLRASSYVYQPWYAQVSGDLGLVQGTSKQTSTTSDGNQSNKSKNTAVTYGGNLSLFPQSRFPFQAYVQSSDSRANFNDTSAGFTSMRFGARQSYRPEVGQENYSGTADRSIITSGNIRSVVDALQGNYSTTLGVHSLSANARYSSTTGDVGGQGSNLLTFAGSHSWRDDEEGLTIGSSASYSNNQITVLGGDGMIVNNSQIMQAGSAVTWVPDEDLPLTITGGGNVLHLNTNAGNATTAVTNLYSFANANYRITDNLTANGGVTLAQNQANGLNQTSSSQNASISYLGPSLNFDNFFYTWGLGGNASNTFVTGSDGSTSVGGSAQHGISRQFILDPTSSISLNAGQSFSISSSTGSGQVGVLSHTGGASWRLALGERTAGTLSGSVSDSMSTGAYASHFRNLSAQGNLQAQLSARSSLGANLNFVVSQQLKSTQAPTTASPLSLSQPPPSTDNGNRTVSGSGSVSYMHRNPFDVANLMYTATLQVNTSQSNLRVLAGDPNANTWQTGTVFTQNADYRIGRLIFRATGTFATLNGKENASVFLTIGRELGDL